MWDQLLAAMPFVWLVIVVIAAIVEAVTVQLVSIWFAVGGIAAVIAAPAALVFRYSLSFSLL